MDVLERPPDYQTFLKNYLIPNRPLLIKSGVVEGWRASKEWIKSNNGSSEERIDFERLEDLYGDLDVTAVEQDKRSPSKPREFVFRDLLKIWKGRGLEDRELGGTIPGGGGGGGGKLYLKDWHLPRICEDGDKRHSFYQVPDIFFDDWMNDYYNSETEDDFRFVYMGEKGTFTPLHSDVWKKRWRLYEPGTSNVITIEQNSRELMFVPSGWKHEVENESQMVISINQNWCNSVNLVSVYDALRNDVEEVERSIEDVRDLLKKKKKTGGSVTSWETEWIEVVQDLVRHHSGWK